MNQELFKSVNTLVTLLNTAVGASNCDLRALILNGCPKCHDTDSFPFLKTEALTAEAVTILRYKLKTYGEKMTMNFDDFTREFKSMITNKVKLRSLKTAMTGITSSKCFKQSIRVLHD